MVGLSFSTQQLNWIKSLLVRLCATNHAQARLQQPPQDGKIILDLVSLPAPTVLLRIQGNWFSSLASKERNFSRLISPRTEKSQLITTNNPLIKVELQGGLKTWGFSFQAQTSGAGVRSRLCVEADEVQMGVSGCHSNQGFCLLPSLPSSSYCVYLIRPTNLNMLFVSSLSLLFSYKYNFLLVQAFKVVFS